MWLLEVLAALVAMELRNKARRFIARRGRRARAPESPPDPGELKNYPCSKWPPP